MELPTLATVRSLGYNSIDEYVRATQSSPTSIPSPRVDNSGAAAAARAAGDRALAGVARLTGGPSYAPTSTPYRGPLASPGEGQAYYRDPNGALFVADRPPPAPLIREKNKVASGGGGSGGSVGRGAVGSTVVGGGARPTGGTYSFGGGGGGDTVRPAWIGGPAEVNPAEIEGINRNAQFFASKKGVPTEVDAAFASKFPNSYTAARLGESGRTGVGSYYYAPGTLGSSTGIDYFGPMDRTTGRPASANSGPWTIRAHGQEEGTGSPVPRGSLAEAQGYKTYGDVSAAVGRAGFIDALRADSKLGQDPSRPNEFTAFGGREPLIKRVLLAEPGTRVGFPDQFMTNKDGSKGSVTNASTYIPLTGELSRPTVFVGEGANRQDQTAKMLASTYANKPDFALREGVDPRYAADVFDKAGKAELAQTYRDFASQHDFIDRQDGKIFYAGPKGTPVVPTPLPKVIPEEQPKPKPPPPPEKKKDEEE